MTASAQAGSAEENPVTLVFDLDGTLCTNTFGEYDRAEPHPLAIERVNRLSAEGYRILVFTARGTATGIDWGEITRTQLERWGLRYDELHFGKPSGDVYIDDRAVHTDSWLRADAFTAPGHPLSAGEGLPPAPAPDITAASELGRTFAGARLHLAEHAAHAVALATAAGLEGLPSPVAVADAVGARLDSVGESVDGDLVYSIVIWAGERRRVEIDQPAADPFAEPAAVAVGCRPLAEHVGGGTLEIGPSCLAIGLDGRLLLPEAYAHAAVMANWIEALAREAGIGVERDAIEQPQADACEEAMLIGMPHCLLPLAALGGREMPGGAGLLAGQLLGALREATGLDLIAQLRELAA